MFHPFECDLEGALYMSKYVFIFSKYSDCLQFMKRHTALEITSTNYQKLTITKKANDHQQMP
jgi:hypothetical protein